MRYPNSQARAAARQFREQNRHVGRGLVAAGRQLNWCVAVMLNALPKADNRHCSFKDQTSTWRHQRTVWCHQAVQLLLALLSQHQSAQHAGDGGGRAGG